MAKGVKNLKMVSGLYYGSSASLTKSVVIKPNQDVCFKVNEWLSGTTEQDKKKPITWFWFSREKAVKKKMVAGQLYLSIPKNLCGSYTYYIEASLSGNFDLKSGIYARGQCEAKILKSKWCFQNDGTDARSHEFSFGQNVFLGLETEGINGNKVIVEVYLLNTEITFGKVTGQLFDKNYDPTKDDIKSKVFEKPVEVIDGEINTEFTIQPSWKKKNDLHQFYIKVRDGKNYIYDGSKQYIHARFLKVKNNIIPIQREVTVLASNAPVKVGAADKNLKVIHHCKFEEINIDDNGEHFVIFKEGATKLKKTSPVVQYAVFRVLFDFDQYNIRLDANETLKYLLDFLLYNQHLDMALAGHADDRGTLQYNQTLSENRAKAVKGFFAKGGLDPKRIKTQGFGKVLPIDSGKNEVSYQKNRRVEIQFSYLEYNQEALVYETIAPNGAKFKDITINVINRSDKGCFRKEKHNKNIISINETGGSDVQPKQGNKIKQTVFSQKPDFPANYVGLLASYLNPFSKIYYQFAFHINSCAYYADKEKATLEVRVYPDIIWIGHFQYNYKDAGTYFFHKKNFDDLTTGITDVVNELKNTIFYKIYSILPNGFIADKIILPYIEKQAQDYTYGIHTIHNRTLEKQGQELSLVGTQTNLITQTKYTKYMAAAVVYSFVVVGIIIDLLMIYLTRGKNLEGRILKLANAVKKSQQYIKLMEDAGVDIIPPSIAINAGMYYQKQKDGRLALVYEANLKANPLIALNYNKEFDLLGLITKTIEGIKNAKHPKGAKVQEKLQKNKNNNSKIAEFFKSKGVPSIKGTINIKGDIVFEHNLKYNVLTNTYSILDKLGNGIFTAKDEILIKEQISFNASVLGTYKYDFDFDPLQSSIEGKIKIQLQGACGIKLKYGVDTKAGKGLFVSKSLYCSGVEGTYSGSLKASNFFGLYEYETNDGKPIPFTLIEPFEVPLFVVQLFKS